MRVWTDKIESVQRSSRYLGLGLVVLAAAFLGAGRWDLSLAVGVGALLGWVLTDPVRITWAIFVVAFAIPVTIDFGYPTNPSYTLFLLLFILGAWGRVLRAERDGWPPRLIGAALLLPLSALLSGVVHWHGAKPIVVGLAPLLCVGAVCWHVIEEGRRDPQLIRRLAVAFTWFGLPVAMLAAYQTSSGTWPIFDQLAYHWTYTSAFDPARAAGLSGHPIIYGTFAMGMALIALTLRGRWWYVPFTANLAGLVLSGTRSAWVGMFLALTLWVFYHLRGIARRRVVTGIAITAASFVIVAGLPDSAPAARVVPALQSADRPQLPYYREPVPPSGPTSEPAADPEKTPGSRISDPLESTSANARLTRIRIVWDGITQDWSTVIFGHGPEANVRYLEDIGIPDGQAQVFDNTYLTIWYNLGLIGLAGLLLLMAAAYRRCRALSARVIMVGFAVQIFFFDVWLWPGATAVFILAVGLGAAANPAWAPSPLRVRPSRKGRRLGQGNDEAGVGPTVPGLPSGVARAVPSESGYRRSAPLRHE